MLGLIPLLAGVLGAGGVCPEGKPRLVLATAEGSITADLFEAAAPRTLKRLAELFADPRFASSPERTRASGDPPPEPVTFDYTHPHVEIYTSILDKTLFLDNEIDAAALGLDRDRIADAGKATDVIQREVVPAVNKIKRGRAPDDARLEEWMGKWRASGTADFLVGVSRQEINEALGYVYTKGLESRPVTKGALVLQPDSPKRARARLGIALSNMPTQLGRQMVIGQVVSGFPLADSISIRPLDVPEGMKSLDFKPRSPMVVRSVQVVCHD